MRPYDVVLAGHLARDRNVYDGRAVREPGGAVYFGGAVLAALGVRGAILTRLAERDGPLLESLRSPALDVHWRPSAETTGIENTYLDASRDRRTCRPLAIGQPFGPDDFPPMRAGVVHVAPLIRGEAPEAFVREIARWGPLSVDAQGFLRTARGSTLTLERNPDFEALLPAVAFLKLDHAEAETMTGTADLDTAIVRLRAMGVPELVLTHAEGVTACWGEASRAHAPWTARCLAGRTGRGDTCMAAYLAARAVGLTPEQALPLAAFVTSRKMERQGPFTGSLDSLPPEVASPLEEKLSSRT